LAPAGFVLEIVMDAESSLQVAERVAEHSPRLVVVSHLPPEGLTLARYLVRRLRSQFVDMPIIVGRWGETGASASAAERLTMMGATAVIFTLAEARDRIQKAIPSTPARRAAVSPVAASI
jgi:methylmalonyl-CoA mutase cobalamin-binding subunit